MKAISKKQFDNAVKNVLSGGTSILILTKEVYPFYWTRSKGHCNLHGVIPQNSKFIGNTGRGGAASDLYLVCFLANGYIISETKTEKTEREKLEAKKADLKAKYEKEKRDSKKVEELKKAESFGLTVKDYRKKLSELKSINDALYAEYESKKNDLLNTFDGRDAMFKIQNRVLFARLVESAGIKYEPKNLQEII